MARGGKRENAGRPKKAQSGKCYDDPLAYLLAVAVGTEPPDSLRIQAAKALLPFTAPRTRAPVKSRTPRELQNANIAADDVIAMEAWRARAKSVRDKHGVR